MSKLKPCSFLYRKAPVLDVDKAYTISAVQCAQATHRLVMQLQTVESSMIHAVGYDEEQEILEVVFNSGNVYQYTEVPKNVYDELMAADSKGSYMNSCVIDCYPYNKLRKRRR